MSFLTIFLLFSLFSLSHSQKTSNPRLPRWLFVESSENVETRFKKSADEVRLRCTSWRIAGEANNLNPRATIPKECAEYVKAYMLSRDFIMDLKRVLSEAGVYAKTVKLNGDGKDAWVFDLDETLLSNLPYFAEHGYGLEVFNQVTFDEWVEKGTAPAIRPVLKLYNQLIRLGFKVFLVSGRSEKQRGVTIDNLINVGVKHWDKLILRSSDDEGKHAIPFKSEKRIQMVKEGYRIHGNVGDQWSDLLGPSMSNRSFKLPDPMYQIP